VIQELVVPRFAQPGSRVPVRVPDRRLRICRSSGGNPNSRRGRSFVRPLASLPVTLSGAPETYDLMIEPDQAPGGDMVLEIPPLPAKR